MALQFQDGRYVRINKETIKSILSNIQFNVFKNKEVRLSPGEFDLFPGKSVKVELSDEFIDSVVSELYTKLKQEEEFEGSIDA